MTLRSRVAAVFWLVTVVGAVLLVLGAIQIGRTVFGDTTSLTLLFVLLGIDAVVYATVGSLLVTRRPGNVVGWILIATAPMLLLTFSGYGFAAILSQLNGTDDLVAGLAAWTGGMTIGPTLLLAGPLLCLYFPDGRLPGRRWRFPVAILVAALALSLAGFAVQPGPVDAGLANNPFGIDSPLLRSLAPLSGILYFAILLAGAALAVVAVAGRFRGSRGRERAQLKWLLAASAVLIVAIALASPDDASELTLLDAAYLLSLSLIPVAVGIAILRYRLYDIDRIISRTVAYAVLTVVLAIVFVGIVLGLQAALSGVTQGETIPVAVSTLVVAALAQPLRRRVQSQVDRRFNRAGVDADRTVAAFAVRMRDEVEMGSLRDELVSAIGGSLQPASLGVWIRSGGGSAR